MLTHAGLFSGIGGFSLAAQWMGWQNVFEVELNEWCRQVLHKNFPLSQLFDDVCLFSGLPFRGLIDILSGGFPCQPWSSAGKGLGTADPRHLWPQFLRIIREIQPRFVVGENVRGILSWGGGLQFEAICADLEAEGYEVLPFLLPAVGVGAIHKRDRFWFVAHATRQRRQELSPLQREAAQLAECGDLRGATSNASSGGFAAQQPDLWRRQQDFARSLTSNSAGLQCQTRQSGALHQRRGQAPAQECDSQRPPLFPSVDGCAWPLTEPALRAGNDGVSGRLVRPDRAHILKAAGNAIVPQVAYQIFQAIQATL